MAGRQSPTSPNGLTLEFVIPSEPDKTADVDRIIEDLTVKAGYGDGVRGDIAIAVNEVVKNAILHGNKCDITKEVTISCSCAPSEFRIIVCDRGDGFDPDEVPDPLDPENLLKESGRGLLILRTLMDEVRYEMTSSGTRVTLVKVCA